MTLPRITFPTLCCFLLPLAIGLTFPIQVMAGSSAAGSVAFVLQFFLIALLLLTNRVRKLPLSKSKRHAMWDPIVAVWLLVALINIPISWVTFGPGAVAGSVPVIYLIGQAALMYFYFSRIASDQEIKSFFAGMVAMGLISGGFFVFDSFYKLALGRVTSYALRAHAYSTAAAGTTPVGPDANTFRIDIAYRSFGFLERHATSALWMAFGFFAYSLVSIDLWKKRTALGFTVLGLLITQNFTSIVAFGAVALLLYRKSISIRSWILPVLVVLPVVFVYRERIAVFFHILSYLFQSQVRAVFGIQAEGSSYSLLPDALGSILSYGREIAMRPHELLLGFGMGTNPFYGTSGHFGYLEAMLRMGLPLWIFFTWSIFRLVRKAMKASKRVDAPRVDDWDSRLVLAAAAILACTWLMDLHYTAWPHKSVWPILFFSMALARRLDRPRFPSMNISPA
jgi:hypothetical protein